MILSSWPPMTCKSSISALIRSWNRTWPVKIFSVEPTIDPAAKLTMPGFGAYCEVGARTVLHDVTMDDYSYVVNDAQITYTTIGKFCSIAAMTRINPGNHPMPGPRRRISPTAPAPISPARRMRPNSSNGGADIGSGSAMTSGSGTAPSSCRAECRYRCGGRGRRDRDQGRPRLHHRRRKSGTNIKRRFPEDITNRLARTGVVGLGPREPSRARCRISANWRSRIFWRNMNPWPFGRPQRNKGKAS